VIGLSLPGRDVYQTPLDIILCSSTTLTGLTGLTGSLICLSKRSKLVPGQSLFCLLYV
jgi:hypothetical protein